MTDRELLELAAKAAGLEFHWIRLDSGWLMQASEPGSRSEESWNPLVNDGDALRLAVRLALTINIKHHETEVFTWEGECFSSEHVSVHPDHSYEATRRAIVEAAAEIGKTRSG
ncbi:hypothetical protein ELS24_10075 [Achromobacter spanius]|uniref:hypothetical protein n=1 Tax=Achromobacter spanius TaxID=217203 RepID=UPI000F8FAF57|nr:hypothetical protein [Achromobacter spanius]AZS78758.1 hypothetical protein ELS24_10075 [Achromobacter spanius]